MFLRQLVISALCLALISPKALAQEDGSEKKVSGGPRRQMATIVFAGLAGATLGLSTLSFYGRPQDKLANIAMGFALGVIVGTVFVTFKTASPDGGGFRPGEPGEPEEPQSKLQEKSFNLAPMISLSEPQSLSNEPNYYGMQIGLSF